MKRFLNCVLLWILSVIPSLSIADISSTCAVSTENSTYWWFHCEILVHDHRDIPDLLAVKVEAEAMATWWQNGINQGTLGPLPASDWEDIGRVSPSFGVWIMNAHASSRIGATKYLNPGPNQTGITWDEVCQEGEFFGYLDSASAYVHEPQLDKDNCFFRTTE